MWEPQRQRKWLPFPGVSPSNVAWGLKKQYSDYLFRRPHSAACLDASCFLSLHKQPCNNQGEMPTRSFCCVSQACLLYVLALQARLLSQLPLREIQHGTALPLTQWCGHEDQTTSHTEKLHLHHRNPKMGGNQLFLYSIRFKYKDSKSHTGLEFTINSEWPWTPAPPASTSQMLGLEMRATPAVKVSNSWRASAVYTSHTYRKISAFYQWFQRMKIYW